MASTGAVDPDVADRPGRYRNGCAVTPLEPTVLTGQRIVRARQGADGAAVSRARAGIACEQPDNPARGGSDLGAIQRVVSNLFPIMALDVVDGGVRDRFGFVHEPTPAKAATDHLDLVAGELADGRLCDVAGGCDLVSHGFISLMKLVSMSALSTMPKDARARLQVIRSRFRGEAQGSQVRARGVWGA